MTQMLLTAGATPIARPSRAPRPAAFEVRPQDQFDRIVSLARVMLRADAAVLTLAQGAGGRCPEALRGMAGFALDPATVAAASLELPAGAGGFAARLGLPLVSAGGEALGAIVVYAAGRRKFSAADRAALADFAALAVAAVALWQQAATDALTGALTRRAFRDGAERALSRHARGGSPVAVVMMDLDHFKAVNDTRGHAAGDAVLRAVGAAVARVLRAEDQLGRLGGEEFALLLEGVDAAAATEVAERLREVVEALEIPGWPGLRVTASFGVAATARDRDTVDALLAAADAQLYAAKRAGRNCTRALADTVRRVA